jgi:rod shape determining protein RodA
MKQPSFLRLDFGLLIPVLPLVVLSLVVLLSINADFFRTQFLYVGLSIAAFILFSHINIVALRRYTIPIYIVSLIILIGIFAVGIESRGAVRWVDFFGLRIQFSEILKPFLIFAYASYLENRELNGKTLIHSVIFSLPILFLIFIQPDLGSAVVYGATMGITMLILGFPLIFFAFGIGILLLLTPLFWQFLHDYQKQRVLSFFSPSADPLGTSYNAIQSIIAVGSGMFIGRGLGQTTQSGLRFLPERHTDFIFATISEALGFVGGIVVILALAFLLFRIYALFLETDSRFCKIFAVLTFSLIFVQSFFNIGMNIGIVPIVGVTLPFVSYGGSSLLSCFVLLGLLSSISAMSRENRVLEIR